MAAIQDRKGPNNPNWKGGRVVDPRGYVLIRVGKDHPLADVRGYAYEHRLVAAASNGGVLPPKVIVHHGDDVKGNNAPENLETMTRPKHAETHRKRTDLRPVGADNPVISCACGCGETFSRYDGENRPRRFVSGHNLGGSGGR